jgi:predicted KAP-like P-loop ATPase
LDNAGDKVADRKDSLILIDEMNFSREEPVHNLDSYSEAIVKIIKQSEPKFTIGIYGEWGNGKTTLMKRIQHSLENNETSDITTVWFSAWRYEREEYHGITALLKSIAIELDRTGHYKELRPLLKRSAITLGKDVLRQVTSQFITDHGIEAFEKILLPKLENLPDIDKDTIYFDGLRNISEKFKEIRNKHPEKRIVIFVDDLDRCSPKKALELFESIKAFLDIEGFIYVIGLSHETVSKIITQEYNIHGISGDDYIKKIIQIPIHTPNWISDDIKDLVKFLISKLNHEYRQLIDNDTSVNIISESIEKNPREIKRFLNNLIVALEIFKKKNIKLDELLIVQILNMRWNGFYNLIMDSSDTFRKDVLELLEKNPEDILKELNMDIDPKQSDNKSNAILVKRLYPYRSNENLWSFLVNQRKILQTINWTIYHMAVRSSSEIPIAETLKKQVTNQISYLISSPIAGLVLFHLRNGERDEQSLISYIIYETSKLHPSFLNSELLNLLSRMNDMGLIVTIEKRNTIFYKLTELGSYLARDLAVKNNWNMNQMDS